MNGVNFSLDVILPLQTVANSCRASRSRHVEYLKLVSLGDNHVQYLTCTSSKAEATSLKILSESFGSNETGNLGHRLHSYFVDLGKNGREVIEQTKNEMMNAIEAIKDYDEARRTKWDFKWRSVLSKCLCFIDSPEEGLREKMEQFQTIANKIQAEYDALPTTAQIELEEARYLLEELEERHKSLHTLLAFAERGIERIKVITENYQGLIDLSDKDNQEIEDLFRQIENQMTQSFIFSKGQMDLEKDEQKWLDDLKIKNFTSGFRVRLALTQIKHLRVIIAKESVNYEQKRNALVIEINALEKRI